MNLVIAAPCSAGAFHVTETTPCASDACTAGAPGADGGAVDVVVVVGGGTVDVVVVEVDVDVVDVDVVDVEVEVVEVEVEVDVVEVEVLDVFGVGGGDRIRGRRRKTEADVVLGPNGEGVGRAVREAVHVERRLRTRDAELETTGRRLHEVVRHRLAHRCNPLHGGVTRGCDCSDRCRRLRRTRGRSHFIRRIGFLSGHRLDDAVHGEGIRHTVREAAEDGVRRRIPSRHGLRRVPGDAVTSHDEAGCGEPGIHETLARPSPAVANTISGLEGVKNGVTEFLVERSRTSPCAVGLKDRERVDGPVVQASDGRARRPAGPVRRERFPFLIVYPVIGLPPVLVGGDQVTVACWSPATAQMFVTTSGVPVASATGADDADSKPSPSALVACTENVYAFPPPTRSKNVTLLTLPRTLRT